MSMVSIWRGVSLSLLVLGATLVRPAQAADAQFVFQDRERIVFLGATLLEREQEEGYLETLLTARFADLNLSFRNLAWSGDTVWGDSRAAFDTAKEGFERMVSQVHDAKPAVLVLEFGRNESFAGAEGLTAFVEGYNRLLDAVADTNARLIFLGPARLERAVGRLSEPVEQNHHIALYGEAIRSIASGRGGWYIDLAAELEATRPVAPVTFNSMHFTPYGYWIFAQAFLRGLGYETPRFMAEGLSEFNLNPKVFFSAPLPADIAPGIAGGETLHLLRFFTSDPGTYRLESNGTVLAEASNDAWAQGIALSGAPEVARFEALRAAVKEKNRLFFNRWRPQNETYIFGFRKHEQGQYAAEIPQYDPLIEVEERTIAELSRPQFARCTMRRVVGAE